MNNLYKFLLLFLILVLLVANITFFAYNAQFMSYFKLDSVLETPEQIIEKSNDSITSGVKSSLDLSILDSDKFNQLKDFKVDINGLELPDDLKIIDEETGEIINGPGSDNNSEFEIGNDNPFAPAF